jgi:SWI/SNF-related matrix-associated actin-dependent regulator of chromatin subfamily B member 1
MANPHQQYPYNARPPSASYPNAGGMMNMNPAAMNLNMGGMPSGVNMGGMQNMGGMGTMQGSPPGQMSNMGAPNPMQQHQLLNQYQLQMRAHAGNGIAQQQQQLQNQQMNPQQHQAPQPFGGAAPGMGMQHQQMPGSGMSIAMPPNQYSMGGMNQPMNMKQPSGMPMSYPQQTYQQTPQQPQYPSQSQPYPGNGGTGVPMGYPQRPPTAQGGHVGPPSTPTMQQHQPNPALYSQGGMGMGMSGGGGGMPGMNPMGYQQNGMPGRPPSAMGGMQQSMAGMPPSNKPPQTPSMGGMNPPPPMHTPMMTSQPLGNQGMGMGPPSTMMGNPSGMQPQNPMQTSGITPQQMQMMQFQQMQRQQHQQGMMMNDMQQQQQQHPGPPSIQIPASPATNNAMSQPPLSSTSAPGRTPTPTLPPQSSGGMRSATPTSAQAPQQPPMHAPSPIHGAGGPGNQPMSARPPSAAAGSVGSGAMAPPGGSPNKMGYPMSAPGSGMGMGGMNTSHMDPSVLQMLGNQAGVGGVSSVGSGMFSNPIVPPTHNVPAPGMHPGSVQTNGAMGAPMGSAPGMHGQPPALQNQGVYNPAMGSNGLRQVGPAPIPSLQMHSRGSLPSNLSIGGMGPSALPGQIPLTMGGPSSSAQNAMNPNSIGNPLALSSRPGRAPSHPPAPQPQQQPQQTLNHAERTMSPRQRAAVIPTITRITSVPADDKDHPLSESLPVLSSEEIENVRDWIGKDRKYEGEYRKMKEAMGKELAESFGPIPAQPGNASGAVGKVLRWFEKDWREDAGRRDPRHPSGKLMWPQQKRLEKERRFRLLGRKPVFLCVLSSLVKQIRALTYFADLNLFVPKGPT